MGSGPACTCHHLSLNCPATLAFSSPVGHSPQPQHPAPCALVLGLSTHLDTRLALAFPLGLSSKVTCSERPPRTAVSKPAPLSPHPFFDFYFFPTPGLLVLACLSLAGPPCFLLYSTSCRSTRCICPTLAPTPWSLCGWGLPTQVRLGELSPYMPWAAPGTLALQITPGKLSQALP